MTAIRSVRAGSPIDHGPSTWKPAHKYDCARAHTHGNTENYYAIAFAFGVEIAYITTAGWRTDPPAVKLII